MEIIYSKKCLNYDKSHPEWDYRVRWIESIWKEIILDSQTEILKILYDQHYINKIRNSCKWNHYLRSIEREWSNNLYISAVESVNLAISAYNYWNFAITRPPWHHWKINKPMWFCLFNNIAIVTKSILDKSKKVCIIDIDWHYGNWTDSIFQNNDNVLYISLHQVNSYASNLISKKILKKINKWLSIHKNLNKWTLWDEYISIFESVIPDILRFNPDVIWISAGFDTYFKEELLDLKLQNDDYFKLWKIISNIKKRTFALLEWGYHSDLLLNIQNFVNWFNS